MSTIALSPSQLDFLAFADSRPKPFAWRWCRADGQISLSPATHHHFIARKIVRGSEVHSAPITPEELDALAPFWTVPLLELNAAGRTALATTQGLVA